MNKDGHEQRVRERMCVACRQMQDKHLLIRVVRQPQGTAALDVTGKAAGRGAYLCRTPACLAKAVKSKALDRALKVTVGEDIYTELKVLVMAADENAHE